MGSEKLGLYSWIYYLLALCVLGQSCAQIGRPEGGPKDEAPPVVDLENSTQNEQVFFQDKKIELTFDEWIELSNPTKEVFISPPLDYPPKITSRGKTVTFEFHEDEVLKENTTYQINFGKSIKDLRAGNQVENLVFLFSTGDVIDDLFLKGTVMGSESGKPMADVVIMLYDNLSDTAFTTLKPFYLTRSDKEGQFKLDNLRADTFQIFALLDANVSYTYDVPTELVAFHDSLIILKDTLMGSIDLLLFDEEDPPRFIQSKQTYQGLANLIYQPLPEKYAFRFLDEEPGRYFKEESGDTLKIWHDGSLDSMLVEVRSETTLDTIKIKKGRKDLSGIKLKSMTTTLDQLTTDTFRIEWSKPLDSFAIENIVLRDTSQVYDFREIGLEEKSLWFLSDLAVASKYTLSMDSAVVRDWSGVWNSDSLSMIVRTKDPERFGNINLAVAKKDTVNYILDVIKGKDKVDTYVIDDQSAIVIPNVEAGKYKLILTQDVNGDGKWTPGSIMEKRKPEVVKELTLEELKAGWDLEATVDIQELFYATESE